MIGKTFSGRIRTIFVTVQDVQPTVNNAHTTLQSRRLSAVQVNVFLNMRFKPMEPVKVVLLVKLSSILITKHFPD